MMTEADKIDGSRDSEALERGGIRGSLAKALSDALLQ
jgi:hypothetical protein